MEDTLFILFPPRFQQLISSEEELKREEDIKILYYLTEEMLYLEIQALKELISYQNIQSKWVLL